PRAPRLTTAAGQRRRDVRGRREQVDHVDVVAARLLAPTGRGGESSDSRAQGLRIDEVPVGDGAVDAGEALAEPLREVARRVQAFPGGVLAHGARVGEVEG